MNELTLWLAASGTFIILSASFAWALVRGGEKRE